MSWMVTATSWAPPRLQPDMWVIGGLGAPVGRPETGRGVRSSGASLCPLDLLSLTHPASHLHQPWASRSGPCHACPHMVPPPHPSLPLQDTPSLVPAPQDLASRIC